MGADIHPYVEIRKDGKWELFEKECFTGDWWDKHNGRLKVITPFNWRQYTMFAMMANVRNGNQIIPIKEPSYCLPEDVSEIVRLLHDDFGGHSTSFLTAKELKEFDYNQHPIKGGSFRQVLTEFCKPCDSVDESDDLSSVVDYYDFIGIESLFFTHVNELYELAPNPDDVRVVFWFDS